jgi:hypothetical protein
MGYSDDRKLNLIGELLEKAETQGYLTTDDILDVLPDTEEAMDQAEEILLALSTAGVDLYEEETDAPDYTPATFLDEEDDDDD